MRNYTICYILKMADRRAQRTNIWAPGLSTQQMQSNFRLLHVQYQSEVIRCISDFSDFRQPCNCYLENGWLQSKPDEHLGLSYIVYEYVCRLVFKVILTTSYVENGRWQRETDENMDLRGKYLVYTGYFRLLNLQCNFEIIVISVHFRFSTTLYRRAKRTKIWTSVTSFQCIQGTLDHLVFKVSLRLVGAFPIFAIFVNPVCRKRLVVERNGPEFGPQG